MKKSSLNVSGALYQSLIQELMNQIWSTMVENFIWFLFFVNQPSCRKFYAKCTSSMLRWELLAITLAKTNFQCTIPRGSNLDSYRKKIKRKLKLKHSTGTILFNIYFAIRLLDL